MANNKDNQTIGQTVGNGIDGFNAGVANGAGAIAHGVAAGTEYAGDKAKDAVGAVKETNDKANELASEGTKFAGDKIKDVTKGVAKGAGKMVESAGHNAKVLGLVAAGPIGWGILAKEHDKNKDKEKGASKTSPAKDGGINVEVDGHQVHLTPGTSLTIGQDGKVQLESQKMKNDSVKTSPHPFNKNVNYQANLMKDTKAAELPLEQQGKPISYLGIADQTRQNYAQQGAGYAQTSATVGYQERSTAQNAVNNEKQKGKELQTDAQEATV